MAMAMVHTDKSPAERLRSLVDVEVTVHTHDGSFTGSILSCTRLSVWLIGADDEDAVIPLDEIIGVDPVGTPHAA